MHKVRYVLDYKGGSIQLPQGDTVVGRGLACTIRFNDPSVSRRHLLLRVDGEQITAEELSETNPTRVNGEGVEGSALLRHNDVVELGQTWFRISKISEDEDEDQTYPGVDYDAVTPAPVPMAEPASPAGSLSDALYSTTNVVSGLSLPHVTTQNCPRCRAKVEATADTCTDCGYEWPKGRPTSPTLRIDTRAYRHLKHERRKHTRVSIDLPVIYDSELLTFDAMASDISLGGLFVATELLDDLGTECKVTVLPDGAAAIPIKGLVCRAVTADNENGQSAGMGIRFMAIGVVAKVWLSSLLMKAGVDAQAESGEIKPPITDPNETAED